MNEGKLLILDVSKPEEYSAGHIHKAMNIPADELPAKLARIERYKNEPIVIVCPTGSRAAKATSVLKKAGFKDVSSLEGGMKEWKSQNMPIDASAADATPEKGKQKGKAKA
ncbi:MAG: rhodanese-like domain-containing protein [Burkholderiaceae bacterium]|nr:rhodanese-like domain-containing protein [Burkholderiaceae bacterium]